MKKRKRKIKKLNVTEEQIGLVSIAMANQRIDRLGNLNWSSFILLTTSFCKFKIHIEDFSKEQIRENIVYQTLSMLYGPKTMSQLIDTFITDAARLGFRAQTVVLAEVRLSQIFHALSMNIEKEDKKTTDGYYNITIDDLEWLKKQMVSPSTTQMKRVTQEIYKIFSLYFLNQKQQKKKQLSKFNKFIDSIALLKPDLSYYGYKLNF